MQEDSNYLNAYILWAKTSIELKQHIRALKERADKMDDVNAIKGMINHTFKCAEHYFPEDLENRMIAYFKENLSVKERDDK